MAFPPGAGVIAATRASGQSHLIDVATSELYLMAAQCAVSEACVPIFCDGVSIGALNIEGPEPIEAVILEEMSQVAAVLGSRISELGGVAEPRGWKLLADKAASFTTMSDEDQIVRHALDVATALTDCDAAMFVSDRPGGELVASESRGAAAETLMSMSAESLAAVSDWVDGPKSCYTVGDPSAPGFTGHDSLRVHGVSSLAVTAVEDGDNRIGFLVVARETRELPVQRPGRATGGSGRATRRRGT